MDTVVNEVYDAYIGGEWHPSDETFSVYDPATNDRLTDVAEAGPDGVSTALDAAQATHDSWATYDPGDRATILRDIADEIRARSEALATIETAEVGRPYQESIALVTSAAEYFDYYAGIVGKIEGETIPVPGNRHAYTAREPLGTLGLIVPWNAPLLLGARSIAPALACGNAIVAKPSPEAPISTLKLAEIASAVGLPDGVLNVAPGDGVRTGAALTGSDRVGKIMFTGSRRTGKHVMKAAADQLVPVGLELGGKSPCIVFPDANVDSVVEDMLAVYANCGQVCYATTRLFIHADIYESVLERFVDRIESMRIGPGDENPDIGPLISSQARDRVEDAVDTAVENGARVRAGGRIPVDGGNFYAPTVLDQVDDDAPISCNEIFGPVLTAYEFTEESDVVRRANDTEYGLVAVVWTEKLGRAHRVAGDLEAGTVLVNEYPATFPHVPFGGYKESGIGREKGRQAVDHYTRHKSVTISLEE